jgi:hypothetical protein
MNAHPSQEILGVCRRSYLQDPPHSVGLSSIFTPIQYELDTGVLQGHVGGFDWIGYLFVNHHCLDTASPRRPSIIICQSSPKALVMILLVGDASAPSFNITLTGEQ